MDFKASISNLFNKNQMRLSLNRFLILVGIKQASSYEDKFKIYCNASNGHLGLCGQLAVSETYLSGNKASSSGVLNGTYRNITSYEVIYSYLLRSYKKYLYI